MRNPPSFPETRTRAAHDGIVVEDIARETQTQVEVVARIYGEEMAALTRGGTKITQYLGVLASRRVRLRLRKH